MLRITRAAWTHTYVRRYFLFVFYREASSSPLSHRMLSFVRDSACLCIVIRLFGILSWLLKREKGWVNYPESRPREAKL